MMVMEGYGANGEDEVWISLDPGVSTGWALIDENLTILKTGVLEPAQIKFGLDELIRGCHRSDRVVRVVIERLPRVAGHGDLAVTLDVVVHDIYELVVDTYDLNPVIIPPGEWKPSRAAAVAKQYLKEKWKGPKMTQHEKDAVMMGIYTILKDHSS